MGTSVLLSCCACECKHDKLHTSCTEEGLCLLTVKMAVLFLAAFVFTSSSVYCLS